MASFDLPAYLRRMQKRRRSITLRPIITTAVQEKALALLYIEILQIWREGIEQTILPAYRQTMARDGITRDTAEDISVAVSAVSERAVAAIVRFGGRFRGWAIGISAWHWRKWISALKYATNIDLSTMLVQPDATRTIADVLQANTALVRSVSDDARNRISQAVFNGMRQNKTVSEMAKEIDTALDLGKKRSIRIASDQTVKLAAELDKQRQLDLGIEEFEWMHSRKLHPRLEHKERDGKVFSWRSNKLGGDLPGTLPFCGCKAKAHIPLE